MRVVFAVGVVLTFAIILGIGEGGAYPLGLLLFASEGSELVAFHVFAFAGIILLFGSLFPRSRFSSLIFAAGVALVVAAVVTAYVALDSSHSSFWLPTLLPFVLVVPGALLHEGFVFLRRRT
jgi:hypothetical protein